MNNWEHRYPEDIEALAKESKSIASYFLSQLAEGEEVRLLGELYQVNPESGKLSRAKDKFLPTWQPNVKEDKEPGKGEDKEFRGLYLFAECTGAEWQPVYVGISRKVYGRLKQHGWSSNPSGCTFAYLKCQGKDHFTKEMKAELRKAKAKRDPMLYREADQIVEEERAWLRNCRVLLYPVERHYDLYFHEVAVAGILKTRWNSFRTH